MKRIKVLSMFLLVAMMATVLVGCSKDDDAPVDLKTYAIGTWHSYKATVYFLDGEYAGESEEAMISKTGQYSDMYWELNFQNTNNATFAFFQQDGNGVSHWVDGLVSYSIKGDVVTIRDSESSMDFVFNSNDKTLSVQISKVIDGISTRTVLYLRK